MESKRTKRIKEMAIVFNVAALSVMPEDVKDALDRLFRYMFEERGLTVWHDTPPGYGVSRDLTRLVDDFIDFEVDGSKGAFCEYQIVYDDNSEQHYVNDAKEYESLLSVSPRVLFDGHLLQDGGDLHE